MEKAKSLGQDVLQKHADDVDQKARWPSESLAALRQAGFLGLTVAADFGGAGEGPGTFTRVLRALAQGCASTGMIYLMHICATQVISSAESLSEKADILRDIVAGKHLSTLAFSEKGSRSHFWAPVSQAQRNGSDVILSAEKSWVTSADEADSYIVSTRTANAEDPASTSLYLVGKQTAGVSVSGAWNGIGLRGNASAPMRLENVKVSDDNAVCADGEGFNTMMQVVMPWFQLGNASVSVGVARAATEATKKHLTASKFQHLGQSLASLMNLRARLAQMQILTDTHEAFLEHVAAELENPGPNTMLAVLESKATAAEAVLTVTDLGMRTCGGASFSKHLSLDRHFRDARAGSIMAPTTDVLYDFIGKSLLDMPLF